MRRWGSSESARGITFVLGQERVAGQNGGVGRITETLTFISEVTSGWGSRYLLVSAVCWAVPSPPQHVKFLGQ